MTAISQYVESVSPVDDAPSVTDFALPVDAELLEPSDRALIEPGMEDLWSSLSDEGRQRLIKRLRARAERLDRRNRLRAERSERCARYVDLLCSLPHPSDPGYKDALAAMYRAKQEYLAFPRSL